MKNKFTMVFAKIWKGKRFKALDDAQKVLLVYYMTCDHIESSGTACVPDGYVVAQLGWPTTKVVATRAELVRVGLILHDADTEEVYITGWFKCCAPARGKHAIGTYKRIIDIESDRLRQQALADFAETEGGASYIGQIEENGGREPEPSKSKLTKTSYMTGNGRFDLT